MDVRRVNVLTPTGQALAARLRVDLVPLVLLYDTSGRERYRVPGLLVRPGKVSRAVDDMLRG